MPKGDIAEQSVIDDMVVRMKAEIYARGPIVCGLVCPEPLTKNDKHGYVDGYQPFYSDSGDVSLLCSCLLFLSYTKSIFRQEL